MFGESVANKDKFTVDTYFCSRVERLVKNYKEYVSNVENSRKSEML